MNFQQFKVQKNIAKIKKYAVLQSHANVFIKNDSKNFVHAFENVEVSKI